MDKNYILLVGDAMGADILTIMANHLPLDLLDHVRAIVLLGPSRIMKFKIHIKKRLGGRELGQQSWFLLEVK